MDEEGDHDVCVKSLFNVRNRNDLLDTIMSHCPNVLKILNESPTSSFLKRLMNAGLHDQLSRLQYVASSRRNRFYYYANTVSVFKKTLTTLELPNYIPQNEYGAGAYLLLCKNLNQFPCLQTLKIKCYSKYYLSHYDTLIDHCKGLTNLIISPEPCNSALIPTNSIEKFRPHPKIRILQCTWHSVNAEEQIAYIMRKFPNLKSLAINCDQYDHATEMRFSRSTLMKFLEYINTLKGGDVWIVLNLEDCVNLWASIVNENISTIDICMPISSPSYYYDSEKVLTCFTGKTLKSKFYSGTNCHIKLLSEIGKKVRSLTMDVHLSRIEDLIPIVELVKLCPSLQHLKLVYPEGLYLPTDGDYQNFELKSFTLEVYHKYVGTLKYISFIFPNLKILHLFVSFPYGVPVATTIDMPYTSFDILTCSLEHNSMSKEDKSKVYIRLKTDAGLQFYLATKNQLQQVNEDQHKRLHLDIICRGLTKLKIVPNEFFGSSLM